MWNGSDECFQRDLEASQRLARLGLLLALATALYVVEAQLPPLPLPGARLGLANLVSVLVLYGWGLRETLLLGVLRQILGGILTGSLFGLPFFFGLAGAICSALIMALLLAAGGSHLHPLPVSLAGAIAHNLAQLGVACFFIRQPAVLAYLPYLLYFALPAGALVGYLAGLLLPVLQEEIGVAAVCADLKNTARWRLVATQTGALIILLALAGGGIWGVWERTQRQRDMAIDHLAARILVDGRVVATLPLSNAQTYTVPLKDGHMVVRVENGAARVVESTCPDQVCVRTGRVRKPGQAVVCVPYRMSMQIVATDSQGAGSQDFDAVTW